MKKSYRNSVLEVLSTAEAALLEIVSRAAASGDYSGIDLARGTAGEIERISNRLAIEKILPREARFVSENSEEIWVSSL